MTIHTLSKKNSFRFLCSARNLWDPNKWNKGKWYAVYFEYIMRNLCKSLKAHENKNRDVSDTDVCLCAGQGKRTGCEKSTR